MPLRFLKKDNALRLFIALDVEHKTKQEVNDWRQNTLAVLPAANNLKAIPPENFHITLSFLGTIDENQKQAMIKCAHSLSAQLTISSYNQTLYLNKLGLFEQPKVLYLGVTEVPQWLTILASTLQKEALLQKIFQEKRPYRPHLTLYRKATTLPIIDVKPIALNCVSFSLYLSENSVSGVQYTPIKTWQIRKEL